MKSIDSLTILNKFKSCLVFFDVSEKMETRMYTHMYKTSFLRIRRNFELTLKSNKK